MPAFGYLTVTELSSWTNPSGSAPAHAREQASRSLPTRAPVRSLCLQRRVPRRSRAGQGPARARQGLGPSEGGGQTLSLRPSDGGRRLPLPGGASTRLPPGSAPSRLPPARRAHAWGGMEAAPRRPRPRGPTQEAPQPRSITSHLSSAGLGVGGRVPERGSLCSPSQSGNYPGGGDATVGSWRPPWGGRARPAARITPALRAPSRALHACSVWGAHPHF